MILAEARRPEHRDARTDEVQRAEAAQEVAARAQQHEQLAGTGLGAFEEDDVLLTGRSGEGAGPGV